FPETNCIPNVSRCSSRNRRITARSSSSESLATEKDTSYSWFTASTSFSIFSNRGCGRNPGLNHQEVVHVFLRRENESDRTVHQVRSEHCRYHQRTGISQPGCTCSLVQRVPKEWLPSPQL